MSSSFPVYFPISAFQTGRRDSDTRCSQDTVRRVPASQYLFFQSLPRRPAWEAAGQNRCLGIHDAARQPDDRCTICKVSQAQHRSRQYRSAIGHDIRSRSLDGSWRTVIWIHAHSAGTDNEIQPGFFISRIASVILPISSPQSL